MLNIDGPARKSSDKVDLGVVEKVVILSLESGMWLLLDLENHISRLNPRRLVTLTPEFNLVSCSNTSVDVNVENLSLDDRFLAIAALALILLADEFTLSITVGADSLEALDHGTHLAHHGLHAVAITTSTLLNCTFLSTTSFTLRADNGFLECKLGYLAPVDIFKRDFVHMVDGSGLWWSAVLHTSAKHASKSTTASECGSPTEELGEEILGVHAATTRATF
jgi:hypothetical protein